MSAYSQLGVAFVNLVIHCVLSQSLESLLTTSTSSSLGVFNTSSLTIPTLAPFPFSLNPSISPITLPTLPPNAFPALPTLPNVAIPTLMPLTTPTPLGLPSRTVTPPANGLDGRYNIKVGLLFPNNSDEVRKNEGFGQSAPALNVAMKRIEAERLLPNVDISFVWYIDDCSPTLAAGYAEQLIARDKAVVVIGPPCATSAYTAAAVTSFKNVLMIMWGAGFPSTFLLERDYPSVVSVTVNTYSIGVAITSLMNYFNWDQFALLYTDTEAMPFCNDLQKDIGNAVNALTGEDMLTVSYKHTVHANASSYSDTLRQAKKIARIFVVCLDFPVQRREFMLSAFDEGMSNDEYVYIFVNQDNNGMMRSASDQSKVIKMWEAVEPTDNRDNDALEVAKRSLVMDFGEMNNESTNSFKGEVKDEFGKAPFNCGPECMGNPQTVSQYARTLHDAFYLYAKALNQTLGSGGINQVVDGRTIAQNSEISFLGASGHVEINQNGSRVPHFYVYGLNEQLTPRQILAITMSENGTVATVSTNLTANDIWTLRSQKQAPFVKPECGFGGNQCPLGAGAYVGIGVGIVALVVLISGGVALYFLRERILEQKQSKLQWDIPYMNLARADEAPQALKSLRSVNSATSSKSDLNDNLAETEKHCFFVYKKDVVYAKKHPIRLKLAKQDVQAIKTLRSFDHDNCNRFLGVCLDGPVMYSLWKYCQRGSLQDAIAKETYIQDQFVMFALMRDVCCGLLAIQNSDIAVHGALSSSCCLISDRWQVKIANFGLGQIRDRQPLVKKDLLWTAPELIRVDDRHGTQPGDVYSFAIVCSELLNRETAWDGVSDEDSIDEIIYRLKRGGANEYRPQIHPPDEIDANVLLLIRDCWAEDPHTRPTMENVQTLLKQMLKNNKQSLMDYVFSMLESYAGSLEQEVEQRTKELTEEKKKSDILLYRMLPQQVADKLKKGESVQPESFDMVTVFFSDVVSFTTLASKCTPLQVVNLLNDLYTTFDGIIDSCDTYKVETIGDGYLVVSGLPRRNGDQHAAEIANLSMAFMKSLSTFRVPHLPNERINIRVGFHSGPVVAGVVGLTMPRYCLFGDTVNTASRMESNSKPGRIHISGSANHYLLEVVGGYLTESRGEVMIKGKGLMETFWLVGRTNRLGAITDAVPAPPSPGQLQARLDDAPTLTPHLVADAVPEMAPAAETTPETARAHD